MKDRNLIIDTYIKEVQRQKHASGLIFDGYLGMGGKGPLRCMGGGGGGGGGPMPIGLALPR